MFKNLVFSLLFSVLGFYQSNAQPGDFCKGVTTILKDAPNKFRNLKGKELQNDPGGVVCESGIKLPGAIASRFVVSMGVFYEGAFLQTKSKDDVKPAYNKYKELLSNCLLPLGYKLVYQDNFYPGLVEYKKLAFMPEIKGDEKDNKPPAHVTMEATYSKEIGKYTLVIHIFEH